MVYGQFLCFALIISGRPQNSCRFHLIYYLDDQEISMLALHLLQISLVYMNTLMVQDVLKDEAWLKRLTKEDYRGLTPLFYSHIEPYGMLRLDMEQRLALA
jgi:Tn3 transposase DDE domain